MFWGWRVEFVVNGLVPAALCVPEYAIRLTCVPPDSSGPSKYPPLHDRNLPIPLRDVLSHRPVRLRVGTNYGLVPYRARCTNPGLLVSLRMHSQSRWLFRSGDSGEYQVVFVE